MAAIGIAGGAVSFAASIFAASTVPLEQLTWRYRNPYPTGQGIAKIVAGPGCFIGLGEGGLVLRSINGVFWDVVPMPIKAALTQGCYAEGEFLVVGEEYICTSPDGLTWRVQTLPLDDQGEIPYAREIARLGDRRAVLSYRGVYVSDDGTTWTPWPFTHLGYNRSLALAPDRIIVVNNLVPNTTLLTATNAGGWTQTSPAFLDFNSNVGYADGQFIATASGTVATSADGVHWTTHPFPTHPYYGALHRAGSRWMLGMSGPNALTSLDGRTWTEVHCDAFDYLQDITWRDHGIWIATGSLHDPANTNQARPGVATSTDGMHWTRRDSGVGPWLNGIGRIADRVVAVGNGGVVMSSADGKNWDQQVIGSPDISLFDLIASQNVVYTRSATGDAYSTPDGVNWTPAASLPPMQWEFNGITPGMVPASTPSWAGDRWLLTVYSPQVSTGALYSSTDGHNWTLILSSINIITGVAGRPGAYVAGAGPGVRPGIQFSTDAVTWEPIVFLESYEAYVTEMLEGHGWFLASTSRGIIASPNGRDWQWLPGLTSYFTCGARIDDSFWFAGVGGTIVEVMPFTEAPIANLSTRTYQRAGGLPAIAGFVVEGNEPVEVLVRAVGAGLRDYDVDDVIERPTLHLFEGQTETFSAGDWAASVTRPDIENATRRIGAFALTESGGDAAFVARLPAGAYTAVVQGSTVMSGNVLVEIYDSGATHGTSSGGRLANSSTRGEATLEHPLIGGLIVQGDHPRRVLVRGIGPGLLGHGVPGAAADPRLQIFRDQTAIADNDDWGVVDDPLLTIDAAAASYAFALAPDSLDAAVVVTLAPGLYTVHVSPAKGTAGGEVLLETYFLD